VSQGTQTGAVSTVLPFKVKGQRLKVKYAHLDSTCRTI